MSLTRQIVCLTLEYWKMLHKHHCNSCLGTSWYGWHQGWVGCVHAGQVPGNLHHLLGNHRCDDRGTDCWLGVNYVVYTLVSGIIYMWDEDGPNKWSHRNFCPPLVLWKHRRGLYILATSSLKLFNLSPREPTPLLYLEASSRATGYGISQMAPHSGFPNSPTTLSRTNTCDLAQFKSAFFLSHNHLQTNNESWH